MNLAIKSLSLALVVFMASCSAPPSSNDGAEAEGSDSRHWVTVQYLDRHTCPSERCGVVGRLAFREAATPLETRNGWTRISRPYNASCRNGRSRYVDEGEAACTESNGIVAGQFSEWVRADALSPQRPSDPAETASATEAIVAQSDDFAQHRRAFVTAAQTLIADGRCSAADFEEMGGWLKATMEHRNAPVYFTYCGGMTVANRIYLNVETGAVLR